MLDRGFLRRHFEEVKDRLAYRAPAGILDDFATTDARRRAAVTEIQALQQRRNALSKRVGLARRAGKDAMDIIKASREVHAEIREREASVQTLDAALDDVLSRIPNIPHETVPAGRDETANVEISRWGRRPEFAFTPKPHS